MIRAHSDHVLWTKTLTVADTVTIEERTDLQDQRKPPRILASNRDCICNRSIKSLSHLTPVVIKEQLGKNEILENCNVKGVFRMFSKILDPAMLGMIVIPALKNLRLFYITLLDKVGSRKKQLVVTPIKALTLETDKCQII